MATIKDVARQAGVSVATVSRVLNGSGYYDEDTARRVRQAVESLAYVRNVHWARLARNSAEMVCFLLGNRDALNSMQMRLLVACERVLQEAGYDLVFSRIRYTAKDRAEQLALPRLLSQPGMVDGVVLAGLHYPNLLDRLEAAPLPVVVLGNTLIGPARRLRQNAVTYDDVVGADEAVQHLLCLGHRRVAFVGNTRLPWLERRHRGYEQALKRENLRPFGATEDWQVSNLEYGQLAVAALMRETQPPTALFAANDELAAGCWRELARRHIRVPHQVSLMGFGDREEFSILEPGLTTVSVFPDKLGEQLAHMLLQRLAHAREPTPSRSLPCRIVERGSCGPPRTRLELVPTALPG